MKTSKKLLLIFVSLGLIIGGLIYFVQFKTTSTYDKDLPYISLGDKVKNQSTKAHLWFEEFISGDETINYERDINSLVENSRSLLTTAIKGGEFDQTNFPIPSEEFKTHLSSCLKQLEGFNKFMLERKTNMDNGTSNEEAGSELDQLFDETYEGLQSELDKLIELVNITVNGDISSITSFSLTIALAVTILFFIIAYLMFKTQRNIESKAKTEEFFELEKIRLEKLNKFVNEITSGDYTTNIDLDLSEDNLAQSLVDMRDTLKSNSEEEKKRNWIVASLANFSNILRNNDDLHQLSNNIISKLIEYLNANQGGIFIINEDENNNTFLELTGCYAYGRQKFLEKTVKPGEGLVGQCYLERQPIFITDVPQGYTKIQSGLGDSTPSCLYIFPLIVNDEIYGILEIASFEIFTETQKEFLEKVSESIAATLKNAKTGSVTTKLLAEAQEMAEVMSQQEEEMRQNMEEMQATSETMNQMVEQKDSEIAELKKQIRLLNSGEKN